MSTRRGGGSGKSSTKKDDLLSKEEEFKRLNAELEKKTTNIVYEAEQMLKAQERNQSDTEYLSKLIDENVNQFERPLKLVEAQQPVKFKVEDDFKKFIQDVCSEADFDSHKSEDIVPKVANEMSSDAQIRFLKAKLKVMQEELERSGVEISKRDEENVKLAQRCKELEEERVKQLRISNSHQTQMEKFKKQNEEMSQKLTQTELQLNSLKKENDTLKKDLKKSQIDQSQLEIKLNRHMEEIEKLKLELSKQLLGKKDTNEQEKSKIEHLSAENKRLQKQKQELIQAFRKQMKLIDVLKRQKMHLEAAKMLQFAEQDFLNALDWQNSSPMDSFRHPRSSSSKANSAGSNRPPSGATKKAAAGTSAPFKARSNSEQQLSSREEHRVVVENMSEINFNETNGNDDNNHYFDNGDIIDDDIASEFNRKL